MAGLKMAPKIKSKMRLKFTYVLEKTSRSIKKSFQSNAGDLRKFSKPRISIR